MNIPQNLNVFLNNLNVHRKSDIKERKELFVQWDVSGNGQLSLSEIDEGLQNLLTEKIGSSSVQKQFKPCQARAFEDATEPSNSASRPDKEDFMTLTEFRVMIIQLRMQATIQEVFQLIAPKSTDNNRKITIEDWKNCMVNVMVAAQTWADFVRLKSVTLANFNEMDQEGRGMVKLPEFSRWIRDGEIQAATEIGLQLSIGAEDDDTISNLDLTKVNGNKANPAIKKKDKSAENNRQSPNKFTTPDDDISRAKKLIRLNVNGEINEMTPDKSGRINKHLESIQNKNKEKHEKIDKLRKEKDAEIIGQCTFKPDIHPMSKEIERHAPFHERLDLDKKKIDENFKKKVDKISQNLVNEDDVECTFKPKTKFNQFGKTEVKKATKDFFKESLKLKENRSKNIAKRSDEVSNTEMMGVTHKPVLNKKSEKIMKAKESDNVQDRLYNWHENKQKKIQLLEQDATPHFTPNKNKNNNVLLDRMRKKNNTSRINSSQMSGKSRSTSPNPGFMNGKEQSSQHVDNNQNTSSTFFVEDDDDNGEQITNDVDWDNRLLSLF